MIFMLGAYAITTAFRSRLAKDRKNGLNKSIIALLHSCPGVKAKEAEPASAGHALKQKSDDRKTATIIPKLVCCHIIGYFKLYRRFAVQGANSAVK